ncbi:hypothetical protein V8C40DRAFT_254160 [Trichoderma camerunense]
MYLPYQAISSNDLEPTSLRRRAMQASTINSFDELDWNKDVELKSGFCFRWVFVGRTRIRLFCLAAQAALPLALHFLSFLSTSFFCRVG